LPDVNDINPIAHMDTLPQTTALGSVLELLAEAFEGPRDPNITWFVSNQPGSGVFGTLDGMTPQEASRAPGAGRRSAAAHASHLAFSLHHAAAQLRGEHPVVNWAQSWAVSSVDERGWSGLRTSLRAEYEALRGQLAAESALNPEALTAALAVVAHSAYHLGALRQIAQPTGHEHR
jgi:hypothetical protein